MHRNTSGILSRFKQKSANTSIRLTQTRLKVQKFSTRSRLLSFHANVVFHLLIVIHILFTLFMFMIIVHVFVDQASSFDLLVLKVLVKSRWIYFVMKSYNIDCIFVFFAEIKKKLLQHTGQLFVFLLLNDRWRPHSIFIFTSYYSLAIYFTFFFSSFSVNTCRLLDNSVQWQYNYN